MRLSEKLWTARLAQPARTKARADATAAAMGVGTLELKSGGTVLRTITVAAWTVGAVQSDGRYPLRPGAFTDPETGAGTPDTAVFKDADGDWMIELTAGVGSGEFRLANALTEIEPISRGVFVVLDSTDDIPVQPPDPPVEGRIVAAGSSSIDLWSTIQSDFSQLTVIETGVSGSTTTTLLANVETLITQYNPTGVLLYIGENDISGAVAASTVAANIEAICEAIWDDIPLAKIFVMSIKPSPLRWSWWSTMQTANGLLQTYCDTDSRLTYIDVSTALLSGGVPNSVYYLSDNLHLSSAGYQVWTSIIRPVLYAAFDVSTVSDYVGTLIDDMRLFHDGPSDVLAVIPSWGSGAFLPEFYARPSGWTDGLFWFHVMEDTSSLSSTDAARGWLVPGPYTGNGAPNTRIQARDLQLWYLDMSDVWRLHGHAVRPGSYMPPNSWGAEVGAKSNATWRDETSNGGGASVRDIGRGDYEDHTWHAFTSPKTLPAHKGLASCFFARRILDNTDGEDDRSSCRILGACAGDYYIDAATSAGGQKVVGVTVRPMGYSRFKYMTNSWRMFGFYSKGALTEAQIRANPPPFIGV